MSIDLVPIGRTNKTHGVDGTLRITVEDTFWDDFVAAEVIFLETGGQPAPFFVEDRWGGDPLYLKLEEIDSREAARPLTNQVIFLRREDLQIPVTEDTKVAQTTFFQRWVGYTIVDDEIGEVGKIEAILELPQQFLAVLQYGGQEVMVPLHEDLITSVDDQVRRVVMDLPEGLLSL